MEQCLQAKNGSTTSLWTHLFHPCSALSLTSDLHQQLGSFLPTFRSHQPLLLIFYVVIKWPLLPPNAPEIRDSFLWCPTCTSLFHFNPFVTQVLLHEVVPILPSSLKASLIQLKPKMTKRTSTLHGSVAALHSTFPGFMILFFPLKHPEPNTTLQFWAHSVFQREVDYHCPLRPHLLLGTTY